MRISEKLQRRLEDELGFLVQLPERLPRGAHQRNGGGWAWTAKYINAAGNLGSEDTMTDCVNAKSLSYYRSIHDGSFHIVADGD